MNRTCQTRHVCFGIMSIFIWFLLIFPSPALSQNSALINFDQRLEHYLDQQTREVVNGLVARELQLTQLVDLVHNELTRRGEGALDAFQKVYGVQDELVNQYDQELTSLLELYDTLEHLQHVAEYGGDLRALENVGEVKDRVASVLEDRELYKHGTYTSERVGGMIDEYTSELDTLLGIYDTLENLEKRSRATNDERALIQIRIQKQQLLKTLSQWQGVGPLSEEDMIRYRLEMQNVHTVALEIDSLSGPAEDESSQKLVRMKRQLLDKVDRTVYDLLADAGYSSSERPSISEFVQTWKSERIVDITTRLAEYQVLRNELLRTGSDTDRKRMMRAQLANAFLNYSNDFYLAAEYQFQDILDTYSTTSLQKSGLVFYIAEARYHRNAFDAAKPLYEKVATLSAATSYQAEARVRLMQYALDFEGSNVFFNHYQKVVTKDSLAPSRLINYAHYLAGNKYFDNGQFHRAKEILVLIPSDSEFYIPTQLLLAITHTHLKEYDQAIPIFERLADRNSYPWTGLNTAYIRNTALIRLGMLYYQQGDFVMAQQAFNRVSKGYEGYDQALIGQAWSALQQGDYRETIDNSHSLVKNYLASNFTYEALALSAHCKRLLDQSEEALESYRYVVRSRNYLDLQKEFNSERQRVLDQVHDLDRMERQALDKRQKDVYQEINTVREELNDFMVKIEEKSDTASRLIQDYYDERVDIFRHLEKLDEIIAWAQKEERPAVVKQAERQRARLFKVLQTFRADKTITETAYLVDFPLVAKEGSQMYQRENLSMLYQDLDLERKRIENQLDWVSSTKQRLDEDSVRTAMDLEIIQNDLENLQDRVSQFRKWMRNTVPDSPQSNIDQWSDLSGFGIIDIIHDTREAKLDQINSFTERIETIENIFRARQEKIEARLEQFEREVQGLQERWLSKKIELEQEEKQTYFENYYFDTREREEEDWESRLQQLIDQ